MNSPDTTEVNRLNALRRYHILDTPPEQDFDAFTSLAVKLFHVPIAIVTLVDENRQWFKSRIGLSVSETPRAIAFCAHTVLSKELFIVPDAAKDARFAHNPLVLSDPLIRFYAGAPLITPDGHVIGTLSVIDHVPRELRTDEKDTLLTLSRQVVTLLELRRTLANLSEVIVERDRAESELRTVQRSLEMRVRERSAELERANAELKSEIRERVRERNVSDALVNSLPGIFYVFNQAGKFLRWNQNFENVTGYSADEIACMNPSQFFDDERDKRNVAAAILRVFTGGYATVEADLCTKSGAKVPHLFNGVRIEVGGEPCVSGMGMDICERRQSDEKLRLLNRAIDSSINAIVIIDLAMTIQYVNDAFVKMTGYEKEEMLGKTCELFFGSTLEHDQLSLIRQSLHERREAHFSVRSYRKDRSLYWIDLYIGPVRNAEGNPTHFIGVLNDVSDTKQYEMQLERQANFDLLTHLPNRNLLYDRIRQGIARAHREGGNLAVAFVDLDNFKFINDSLGHNVGDQLLTNVADRMNSVLREGDTLARYGGDEFVYVLCSHQSEEAVAAWMSRLSKAMAPPFLVANQQIYVTFSVGVSFFPQDGQDVDTLLRNADMAMYRAKDAGKNNLQFFTSTMNTRVAGRLSLEGRLRRAIEREEFVLYYQPQLDLRTGRINGMEALIRWVPYDGDIVMPADFIPLAEETGLIVPIGRWVMHTACAQNKAFQEAGLPAISVSVNLSTRQFGPQSLVGLVNSALHRSSLPAACLELEVTESMVMNNPEDAKDILERLKEMGIRLAIDDFGTGYSSFSYLKRFPMDQLKIDQSFIKDIGTSADDAAIVQAIIALGHNLGLRVIAEGVCDERQMHFLRSHGCDEVQGYYCSPPLPFEEMASLLEKEKRNALQ